MPSQDLETWKPIAAVLGSVTNPLRVPYQVALKEAVVAARFQKDHWKPAKDRPGLERVEVRLPEATADEIPTLVRAVQSAHTEYLLIVDPKVVDYGERARFVVDRLESIIEFLLDDDVEEEADHQLEALKAFDADAGESSLALAQSLTNYAGLATSLQPRLIEIDTGFDVGLIAEALDLAAKLADKPGQPTDSKAAREAKLLRDQLLVLLSKKVNQIRSATRYLYRDQPELVREVTSAYERRRRAELRARKVEEARKAEVATNAETK